MVLGHGHRRSSLKGGKSSGDESKDYTTEDETVVDAEQGNVLMHIISQLRPGADLSRVTLPTFILEPRSMLERITNFMAHPETLLPMPTIDDPVQRFIAVVKFYLSGWHIRPPGVKKPLNPILGETFTCYWEYPDHTKGYYISEQTSHHPPKSSYFFMAPEHHIRIDGTLKPRSKFLGNSAASMMEGLAVMRFLNRKERYFITQPNMYARGILFGKMKYELGDHSFVRCPESGLVADLEFKTKGYFGGTYNAIGGYIKDLKTDKNLYELSGLWTAEMYIKDIATGKKDLLFNAKGARATPPTVRPLQEQDERESQRLWEKVTLAIKQKDQNTATEEKSRIEDMQREEAAKRADDGVDWRPKLFRPVHGGPGGSEEGEEDLDWIINARIDGKTPEEQTKQILGIAAVLPGQDPRRRFSIPARKSLDKVPTRSSLEQHHNSYQVPANGGLIEGEGPEDRPGLRRHSQSVAVTEMPTIQKHPPGFWHPPRANVDEPPTINQQRDLEAGIANLGINDKCPNETPRPATHQQPAPPNPGPPQAAAQPAAEQESKQEEEHKSPPGMIRRQDSDTDEIDEFHDAEA